VAVGTDEWGSIRADRLIGQGGFDPDNQADPKCPAESAGAWSETLDTYAYGEGNYCCRGREIHIPSVV